MDEIIFKIIGAVLLICLIIILFPIATTFFLYIEGQVVAQFVGDYICLGAMHLGISILPAQIPYIFIALGWAGYALQGGTAWIGSIEEKISEIVYEHKEEDCE